MKLRLLLDSLVKSSEKDPTGTYIEQIRAAVSATDERKP